MSLLPQKGLPPWATGPAEILSKSLELLEEDQDASLRIAMILIDNAVELSVRTFIGLPARHTGKRISRKDHDAITENFPSLLEGLSRHFPNKITGIDLSVVEWCHGLRNRLYHDGSGLTIPRRTVELYVAHANMVFKQLFGELLIQPTSNRAMLLHRFLDAWSAIESEIVSIAWDSMAAPMRWPTLRKAVDYVARGGIIPRSEAQEILRFNQIRNRILHNYSERSELLTKDLVTELENFALKYRTNPLP